MHLEQSLARGKFSVNVSLREDRRWGRQMAIPLFDYSFLTIFELFLYIMDCVDL